MASPAQTRPGLNKAKQEGAALPSSSTHRQALALAHDTVPGRPSVRVGSSPRAGRTQCTMYRRVGLAAPTSLHSATLCPTTEAAAAEGWQRGCREQQSWDVQGTRLRARRGPAHPASAAGWSVPRCRELQPWPFQPQPRNHLPPGPAPALPAALPPPRSSGSFGRSTAAFLPGGSARALARSPVAASRWGKPAHCGMALPSPCAPGDRAGSMSALTGWRWAAPAEGHTDHESPQTSVDTWQGPRSAQVRGRRGRK